MKRGAKRFFCAAAAVVLTVSLMPLPVFAADGATASGSWADGIEAMLASGDYIEGEAVVGLWAEGAGEIGLSTQSAAPYEIEPLMEVDASAVDLPAETTAAPDGNALTTQSLEGRQDVQIALVTSDTLSTGELLASLADDPNVAFAEPNYLAEFAGDDESDDRAAALSYTLSTGIETQDDGNGGNDNAPASDLTQLQWGNSAKGAHFDGAGNTSINVPGFAEQDKAANMDRQVVVAVLDLPFDVTHPDLAATFMQFDAEQQVALGCGEWGYNATAESTDGILDVPTAGSSIHSTHVAGIIGAQWDGHGTSGVASNVKVVAVEVGGSNGRTSLGNAIRGYAFIDRYNASVQKDQRVIVVNNSWGLKQSSLAFDAAVTELGDKYGTVTLMAAGNSVKNNDLAEELCNTLADNPYAIVVAATDASGTITSFSQWGERTVTLAAPGNAILSTCNVVESQYIPDGSLDTNICYEGFEGAEEPNVWLLDSDRQTEIRRAELDASVRLNGAQGVVLALDKREGIYSLNYVKVEMPLDEAAKEKMLAAENLYIGIGAEASKESDMCYIVGINANVFSNPVDTMAIGQSGFDGGNWGVFTPSFDGRESQADVRGLLDEDELARADKLVLTLAVQTQEPCEALHLDSIGIGTQKVPYSFMTGTSQATPVVTGATAVLASQTGLTGTELASLVISKTRIPESGSLLLRSGGVFDFTVDGTAGSEFAPVVSRLELSGTMLTVWGDNFGTAGTLALGRYVAGKDFEPVEAMPVKWSDNKIVFELSSQPMGILLATVINAAGKSDVAFTFASKGENAYERDRTLNAATGGSPVFEGVGDLETDGALVGLGGRLYYLPNTQLVEEFPAAKRLLSYDPQADTWSELEGLPEYLYGASATTFDGKLVVEGETMYLLPSGEPSYLFPEGQSAEERVYVYDPATGAWSEASNEGMHVGQTIVNDGGQLVLVGGEDTTAGAADARKVCDFTTYGIYSGAGEAFCTPDVVYRNPKAVAKDGVLFLYDPSEMAFMRVENGEATSMDDALPDFLLAKDDELDDEKTAPDGTVYDSYAAQAILSVASDGIVLVGPPVKGGESDTFILEDGADEFVPYAKRVSDARVVSIVSCAYEGVLYVLGSSAFEPGGRLFRSTAMETPTSPGDAAHVHAWDAGTVTKKPTAYKTGVCTYTCTNCGATKKETIPTRVTVGKSYAVSGSTYKVTGNGAKASQRTVTLTKAKNVKNFTVAATVEIKGASYRVTGIGAKAFAKAGKARTVTVETKALTKASVKGSLKDSKVTAVKVSVGTKAQNKTYVAKYKKIFTKAICGKQVTVS